MSRSQRRAMIDREEPKLSLAEPSQVGAERPQIAGLLGAPHPSQQLIVDRTVFEMWLGRL